MRLGKIHSFMHTQLWNEIGRQTDRQIAVSFVLIRLNESLHPKWELQKWLQGEGNVSDTDTAQNKCTPRRSQMKAHMNGYHWSSDKKWKMQLPENKSCLHHWNGEREKEGVEGACYYHWVYLGVWAIRHPTNTICTSSIPHVVPNERVSPLHTNKPTQQLTVYLVNRITYLICVYIAMMAYQLCGG